MTNEQNQVREFMVKAGQNCPDKPTIPNACARELRVKLIAEELLELCEALNVSLEVILDGRGEVQGFIAHAASESGVDLVEAADATADLRVVVIGADVAMGIDGEPVWNEVHRSNMSKFIDGHRRDDGKWVKGPSYSPANLSPIIEAQKL